MRIATLISGRDDRMARHPPLGHDGRIDNGLESLGGQPGAIEIEIALTADLSSLERANPGVESNLSHPERVPNLFHLVIPLFFSSGKERIFFDLQNKSFGPQLIGQKGREIGRDDKRTQSSFLENKLQDINQGRAGMSSFPE